MSRIRAGELDVHVQRLTPEVPLDGDAPIVVCVHGLLTDSLASYYFTLGPAFAERGLDVLMYDLRGHGRTTRPESGYRLEAFIDDLVTVLDTLEITRPVHVIGNSFGGSVAFGLAAARPDRVASVIAIEAEPPTAEWKQRMDTGFAVAHDTLGRDGIYDQIKEDHGAHTARLIKLGNRILRTTTIADDILSSTTISTDLSTLRCPVFAIYGDESGMAPQAQYLHDHLADCRTVVLADQGHSVLVERTAETIELIFEWVRDTSRLAAQVR
ncbi:alpha/beta hydrolase [Amycolatopsis sp. H20-H5]|nr:alpha/beta hydrolase [Amycolatopsis sp. H20-H5]MEC3975507.1 alpha/beta hydrolase [Amycolatopsis sp. H20-H5]